MERDSETHQHSDTGCGEGGLSPQGPHTSCPATAAARAAEPVPPLPPLTFVLRSEAPHGQWQGLIEFLLPGDKGLTDRVGIVLQHTQVAPNLVQEGLQRHTHPGVPLVGAVPHHHGATKSSQGRQEGEAAVPPGGLSVASGLLFLSLLAFITVPTQVIPGSQLLCKKKNNNKKVKENRNYIEGVCWVCAGCVLSVLPMGSKTRR